MLDFDSVENKALNDYLPKIFHSCPFTEELCTTKQCLECAVFNKLGATGTDITSMPHNYGETTTDQWEIEIRKYILRVIKLL